MSDESSKTKNKRKINWLFWFIFAVVIIFVGIIMSGYYKTEFNKRPIVKDKLSDGKYLYNFYVKHDPNIAGRPYIGNQSARLSFIAYLDISSPTTKQFFESFYPQLHSDYIESGKMRFYHKYYLVIEDFETNSDRLILSKSVYCADKVKSGIFYDLFFELIAQPLDVIPTILSKYGVDTDAFDECMVSDDFRPLSEDVSEVDNYGMIGIDPRVYIGIWGSQNSILNGVPSYTRVQRIVRNLEIQLGEE